MQLAQVGQSQLANLPDDNKKEAPAGALTGAASLIAVITLRHLLSEKCR